MKESNETDSPWLRWIEPRADVEGPADRRNARLLTICILVTLVVITLSGVVQFFTSDDFLPIAPYVIGGDVVGIGCLLAARTRFYRVAALTLACSFLLIVAAGIHARPSDPVWEGFITISVVFASTFLGKRQLLAVAALAIASTIFVTFSVPEIRDSGYAAPLILYQLIAVSLLLLGRRHRDRMESDRRERDLQREKELAAARRMETLGRLAGGVAHDFNNLMTVIVGYISMLANDEALTLDQKEILNEVLAASDQAAVLTGQLLTFARGRALEKRVLDINATVAANENLLKSVLGEDIELAMELTDTPLPVLADEGQLVQVLLNLVTNARAALSPGGSVRIESRRTSIAGPENDASVRAPGDYAALRVIDDGSGMSRETLDRVFEPFFTTRGDEGGTGLGMASVYAIVGQHGGHIRAESEPGAGTTFHILLPLTS